MAIPSKREIEEKLESAAFQKLPVWVRTLINNIQMERDAAVYALNKLVDEDTESSIWFQENPCTGEGGQKGPIKKKRYVQSNRIDIDFEGVAATIILRDNQGIDITYSASQRMHAEVAMVPRSFQQIYLISKQHMRNV